MAALTGDDLYRPICEVASFQGWMISHALPVMVGPAADDQACVDFLLRFEREGSPEMSQCVLLQVLMTHTGGREPLSVDLELWSLMELRVLLEKDVRYADYEFASLLLLAGSHGRRFGHTLRCELGGPKTPAHAPRHPRLPRGAHRLRCDDVQAVGVARRHSL